HQGGRGRPRHRRGRRARRRGAADRRRDRGRQADRDRAEGPSAARARGQGPPARAPDDAQDRAAAGQGDELHARGDELMAGQRKVTTYTAKDIQVLEGLDPVRKRPAMYIGGTDSRGYHHLLWEIVDNSIDEVINGHADRVEVRLQDDGRTVTVIDNG